MGALADFGAEEGQDLTRALEGSAGSQEDSPTVNQGCGGDAPTKVIQRRWR